MIRWLDHGLLGQLEYDKHHPADHPIRGLPLQKYNIQGGKYKKKPPISGVAFNFFNREKITGVFHQTFMHSFNFTLFSLRRVADRRKRRKTFSSNSLAKKELTGQNFSAKLEKNR